MDRGRLVHREDAESLQPFRSRHGFHHHPRAFVGSLEAITAQACHVQQDIGHAVVRHDKADPFATSNHLMTPVSSMRFADVVSSTPLTACGASPTFLTGIFCSIPSDDMTLYAAA